MPPLPRRVLGRPPPKVGSGRIRPLSSQPETQCGQGQDSQLALLPKPVKGQLEPH